MCIRDRRSWKVQSKGSIQREWLPNRHNWQYTPKAFQQQYGGQLHVSKPFDLTIKYQNAPWVTLHGSNLLHITITQPCPPDGITFDLPCSAANFLALGIDLRALVRWISEYTAIGIQNATNFCREQTNLRYRQRTSSSHSKRCRYSRQYLSLIHISEPTRPLYISYAVFCLKKKK